MAAGSPAVAETPPVKAAAALLGPLARRDEPIGERTTYRVGGAAALYVELTDAEVLERVALAVAASGVEVLVLGKGSNLLVADGGFAGLCLSLAGDFGEVALAEGSSEVTAGGGVAYPVLARRLAALELSGMSWAVGIPGSVGGAVAMNAGGHGSDTATHLVRARVVDLVHGTERLATGEQLGLAYRHSELKAGEVVLSASFTLCAGERATLEAEIDEIVAWRREHQPGGRNAGSVFTNPAGDAAGRLLEEAGAKGLRVGSAVVSDKHANFIGVDAGGSAEDVLAVIEAARALVSARCGIELRTEVRLVGFH